MAHVENAVVAILLAFVFFVGAGSVIGVATVLVRSAFGGNSYFPSRRQHRVVLFLDSDRYQYSIIAGAVGFGVGLSVGVLLS